jgi:hypothetical protein
MAESVQCKECGFLSVREHTKNVLEETPSHTRQYGNAPSGRGQSPVCFVLAAPLEVDYSAFVEPITATDRFLKVINKERTCSGFVKWQQGYSPREHRDMQISQALLDSQQKWQAEQARLSDERHQQSLAVAVAGNKGNVWSNLVAGIIGAVATLAAVWVGSHLAGNDAKPPSPPPPTVNVQPPQSIDTQNKQQQPPATK